MLCKNNSNLEQTTSSPHYRTYLLSSRGMHQAERNQSDDIWSVMGWDVKTIGSCWREDEGRVRSNSMMENKNSRDRQSKDELQNKHDRNEKQRQNEQQNNKKFERSNPNMNNTSDRKQKSRGKNKSVTFSDQINENTQIEELTEEQIIKIQKYQRECYSIQKYLENTKAYTRTMPNSAIRLFYEKPCLESYGRKNTHTNDGFIYNDYLKTHNVQPHRHQNDPAKYQTYRGALNFGKRTKLDPEERMKRIHRQFSSKMDMKALVDDFSIGYVPVTADTLNGTLKFNINQMPNTYFPQRKSKSTDNLFRRKKSSSFNLGSTADQTINLASGKSNKKEEEEERLAQRKKRSKSFGKKEYLFLYKYEDKDGDVQYCKDRHGITCYVDPSFDENKEAYKKFLRKIKPIQAEDVRPQDRNIDKIMLNNFMEAQQHKQQIPKHYLMPNCQQPYRPQKYSLKARKKSLASTARTNE